MLKLPMNLFHIVFISFNNNRIDNEFYVPKVPRKWFGSADCDTIYIIYLSLSTQTTDSNHFRGTIVCIWKLI